MGLVSMLYSYPRQSFSSISLLPSAKVKTLGKKDTWPKSVHFGLIFAECPGFDTRQSNHVCRVLVPGHSANQGIFAECQCLDTWQTRRDCLCAVTLLFFAERRFHLSAKYLPSAR